MIKLPVVVARHRFCVMGIVLVAIATSVPFASTTVLVASATRRSASCATPWCDATDVQAQNVTARQKLISPKECLLENGLAYGPFRDGQSPEAQIYPTPAQVEEDLTALSRMTRRIRTYSAAEAPFQTIPQVARRLGISVSQGIYLGSDRSQNERQIDAGVKLAQAGLVDSLIVGNEILTVPGSGLGKSDLIGYIRAVRAKAPANIPVSTAEAYSVWEANLELAREVDFVVVHIYPFWDKHRIVGAPTRLFEQYRSLQATLRKAYPERTFRIVIGETGWPSGGAPMTPGVVPSPQNQRRYLEEFMALACGNSIPFYYFSAYDEGWKWREGSSSASGLALLPRDRTFSGRWIGSSWGMLQSDGRLKPHFATLFEQTPQGSRRARDVLVNGGLAADYDLGVDSSHQFRPGFELSTEVQAAGAGLSRRAPTPYCGDGRGGVATVARRDHDGSSRVRRLRIR